MQNHYLEDQMEEITYNIEWKYQKKKKEEKKTRDDIWIIGVLEKDKHVEFDNCLSFKDRE